MRKTLLALAALLTSSSALADTLIYNVNGLQVGADGKLQRFDGLVIGDDGKVEQLIQRTEELSRPIEHEIDGAGRTLLPGLIDAHGHVMGLGFTALQLDLTGTKSIADLQARLKAYAEANPDARWIIGRGLTTGRGFTTGRGLMVGRGVTIGRGATIGLLALLIARVCTGFTGPWLIARV